MPLGAYILCPTRVSRSTSRSVTSSGIFPAVWAASVWNSAPAVWVIRARSAIGCRVPVSLLACMTVTSTVRSVRAAARSAGSSRPLPSTPRTVTSTSCQRARCRQAARTAGCSVAWVITCGRRSAVHRVGSASRAASTLPRMARASASEPLPVNTIRPPAPGPRCGPVGSPAPIRAATWARARSRAAAGGWAVAVAAGGVAEHLGQGGAHRLGDAGVDRGGGVVVQVDRPAGQPRMRRAGAVRLRVVGGRGHATS